MKRYEYKLVWGGKQSEGRIQTLGLEGYRVAGMCTENGLACILMEREKSERIFPTVTESEARLT